MKNQKRKAYPSTYNAH